MNVSSSTCPGIQLMYFEKSKRTQFNEMKYHNNDKSSAVRQSMAITGEYR